MTRKHSAIRQSKVKDVMKLQLTDFKLQRTAKKLLDCNALMTEELLAAQVLDKEQKLYRLKRKAAAQYEN